MERYLLKVEEIDVILEVRRASALKLRVNDRGVFMTVPPGTPATHVRRFAEKNLEWMRTALARQQESARQRRESAQPLTREMVHDFIEDFKPRFEGWQRKMGLMAGVCTFKLMKSRWGSCQPVTRDISINVRLAQYPPECTDYVIVHELAHILEANHSPAFWAIVARYMPDYQRHRARLKLPPDR